VTDRDDRVASLVYGHDVGFSLRPERPPKYAHADPEAAVSRLTEVEHALKYGAALRQTVGLRVCPGGVTLADATAGQRADWAC